MSTSAPVKTLPIPGFFDPKKVGDFFQVPYQERAEQARQWAAQQGITPAKSDKTKIAFVGIDIQHTFCNPKGELFVQGAVEDNQRLVAWLYKHMDIITSVIPTMDTHQTYQIFHEAAIVDADGNHPAPMTIIETADIKAGKWSFTPSFATQTGRTVASAQRYLLHYAEQLEASGKYALIIWPYHAMIGGIGHALDSTFEEFCFFHSIAREQGTVLEIKGGNFLTENYSVFCPEVTKDQNGVAIAQRNTQIIEQLINYDVVIVTGQAKSHCLAWSLRDLIDQVQKVDPDLVKKLYVIEDATSPVIVPGVVDFTDAANKEFEGFAKAGVHLVKTTTPIDQWPDINLNA